MKKVLLVLFLICFTWFSLKADNRYSVYLGLGKTNKEIATKYVAEINYDYPLVSNCYLAPAVQVYYLLYSLRAAPEPVSIKSIWLMFPVRLKYELPVANKLCLDVEAGFFGGLSLVGSDDLTSDNKYYKECKRGDAGLTLGIGPRINTISLKLEGQFSLVDLSFLSLFIGYHF